MHRLLSNQLTSLQIPDTTDTTIVQDYKGEIEEKSKAADALVIVFSYKSVPKYYHFLKRSK
jgi:hypothetical protein